MKILKNLRTLQRSQGLVQGIERNMLTQNKSKMEMLNNQMKNMQVFNMALNQQRSFGWGNKSYQDTFYAKDLIFTEREELLEKPGKDHQYIFGGPTTDYILSVDYDRKNCGWQKPEIKPTAPFMLDPFNAGLNYCMECFEGMKAYQKVDDPDQIILFRINKNFERMQKSHAALGFPGFDISEMMKLTLKLVDLERKWMPQRPLHSLYLRPVSFSMDNKLGLSQVEKIRTFIVLCPAGPYLAKGFVPFKLHCDTTTVRAWPGGWGDKKLGGNYAPVMKNLRKAREQHGGDTCLWLLHDKVLEMGALNIFMYWRNEDGIDELITPPLDGTILPGITRDSALTLARGLGEFKVTEKSFTIQDMTKASNENRIHEIFGTGTAALVSSVNQYTYLGETYKVPIEDSKGAGPLTQRMLRMLNDIQIGATTKPEWQYLV